MNFARFLNQTAVLWSFSGHDGYGGNSFASTPQEISVRWSDTMEIYTDQVGEEKRAKTTVFSETEIKTNDYLYLGTIASLASDELDSPESIDAYRVVEVKKIVTIDASQILYKAYLGSKG